MYNGGYTVSRLLARCFPVGSLAFVGCKPGFLRLQTRLSPVGSLFFLGGELLSLNIEVISELVGIRIRRFLCRHIDSISLMIFLSVACAACLLSLFFYYTISIVMLNLADGISRRLSVRPVLSVESGHSCMHINSILSFPTFRYLPG